MWLFEPSQYQQAIFEFIRYGKGSGVVDAKAGSGKSSTIEQAYRNHINPALKTLFLTFNKSIAVGLENRLPPTAAVKTLNALGNSLWWRHMTPFTVTVENRKTSISAKKLLGKEANFKDFGFASRSEKILFVKSCLGSIIKLVGFAKMHGLFPNRMDGWMPDVEESWLYFIEQYDLDFVTIEKDIPDYWKVRLTADEATYKKAMERLDFLEKNRIKLSIKLAKHLLIESIQNKEVIDFNDQIYMPLYYNLVPQWKYDIIFVDESQDLSDIQRLLIKRFLKFNGRLIAIGDSRQAIYAWRGSNGDSISIIQQEFGATVLPLSICYRCPKSVIEEAQKIVPEIECSPTADEGLVRHTEAMYFDDVRKGDAILCRRNAPLLGIAYTLLTKGIPVQVLGRDIGNALTELIEKFDCTTVSELSSSLDDYTKALLERYKKKGQEQKAAALEDKVKSINVLIQHKPTWLVSELVAFIENIYTDVVASDFVTLSSIHRSKGLEYRRVIIVESHRLGHAWGNAPAWVVQEEQNLRYVAITRAKEELYLLGRIGFIEGDSNMRHPPNSATCGYQDAVV